VKFAYIAAHANSAFLHLSVRNDVDVCLVVYKILLEFLNDIDLSLFIFPSYSICLEKLIKIAGSQYLRI